MISAPTAPVNKREDQGVPTVSVINCEERAVRERGGVQEGISENVCIKQIMQPVLVEVDVEEMRWRLPHTTFRYQPQGLLLAAL